MSQSALGQIVDVDAAELARYEAGASSAPVSVIVKVARALDSSAAELIGEWRSDWAEAVSQLARVGADGSIDLTRTFSRIEDWRVRRAFVDLVSTIVAAQSEAARGR